jgi:hypothetical protein
MNAEGALVRLDSWLESMRGPRGYGGPVAHWWRDSLTFAGTGCDWRYEGIIAGYLRLYERSAQERWLDKAIRAAGDVAAAQTESGNFLNSRFEQNPGTAGTPHEAAADVGLLLLAQALRDGGREGGRCCLQAAERNLRGFYLERMWHEDEQWFRDDSAQQSFVPNKSATLIEALCLWAELSGSDEPLRYVRPTADAILTHQVRRPGSRLDGAIAQNTLGASVVEAYFPYYNARCVPGLLRAAEVLDEPRYAEAACAAMQFVWRWRDPDGLFPQVVYAGGRINRHPRWIAALGDVLRAAELVQPLGCALDLAPTCERLLAAQRPTGAFPTAEGFAAQVSQRRRDEPPDFRDLLGVCGWNDKAFRYLAACSEPEGSGEIEPLETECVYFGRRARYVENGEAIRVTRRGQVLYDWRKGEDWARVHA